jgi:hypothetical protein
MDQWTKEPSRPQQNRKSKGFGPRVDKACANRNGDEITLSTFAAQLGSTEYLLPCVLLKPKSFGVTVS